MKKEQDSLREKGNRGSARSRYYSWIFKRFQRIHLLELADEPHPIALRQIFVPMRVDVKDLDEETMAGPEKVSKEEPPGKALWDLLVEEPFVALSGRPGSGKTTLVQAIVTKLTGTHFYSSLRKRLGKYPGMTPIPLILRNYPDLEEMETLDDLLDAWWREAAYQAKEDKLPLDVPRLKYSFDPDGEACPALLMFDGIDEVGGPEIRARILHMALTARERGFRVLVTGRPSGFQNLPMLDKAIIKTGTVENEPGASLFEQPL
ncbi:MAG: NACHT domain-containing protein, partial [Desulfobacterales bacterium]|nr:NACHT domain-containing protein [Desulfobacterales bacterium]